MTNEQKDEIVTMLIEAISTVIYSVEASKSSTADEKESKAQKVEMLTIKECTEAVQGVSEHTVRKLVKQGKVKSVRTGEGKNGKILVNKADLLAYFQK